MVQYLFVADILILILADFEENLTLMACFTPEK
jgi:hypothetical protein